MKKFYLSLLFVLITSGIVFSQVPDAFSYQAVVRDATGNIIADQNVSFRINILLDSESGSVIYSETHDVTTNSFGLANLKIGQGVVESGTFTPTGWANGLHFIKVEIDAEGGTSYNHLGTTQLISVPYAFHAETSVTAENVTNDLVDDADADPTNEIQTLDLSGSELSLSNGGGTVTLPLSEGGDNWGTQTVVTDATLDGNGTSSNPLQVVGDLTDDQTLSISGNDLTISDGNTVSLPSGEASPWEESTDGIQYHAGKVGINHDPADDEAFLQIWGDDLPAIEAVSTSAAYPAIYAQNNSGTAAYLKGTVEIVDGTEGLGKVLTSDANGSASWQSPAGSSLWTQSGNNIYYNSGNVGIGTDTPNQVLTINGKTSNAYASFQNNSTGNTFSDGLLIGSKTGTGYAYFWNYEDAPILFATNGSNRMTIENDGDVLIEENLTVKGEVNQTNTGTANLVPIAYGTVGSDGSIKTGTENFTVSNPSTGRYEIAISGESYIYSSYVISATSISPLGFIRATSGSGELWIFTYDTSGTANDMIFSFVVYKP